MVSRARDDLPDPERPVTTTSLLRGISTSMFLRLCSRAPLTTILSICPRSALHADRGVHYNTGLKSWEPLPLYLVPRRFAISAASASARTVEPARARPLPAM